MTKETYTREIHLDDYNTIQEAVDASSDVSGGMIDFGVVHIPPVGDDTFTAGPTGLSAAYNQKIHVTKQTQINQGHGISTYITYDGEDDHTFKVTGGSDVWLRDMWIDSEDSTGTYDAINYATSEGFIQNVEVDAAGRYGTNFDGTGVERYRMLGCSIQGTASKSSNMIGSHFASNCSHGIIGMHVTNGNAGGSIHDEAFGNVYFGLKLLNDGAGDSFKIDGNAASGAAISSFSGNGNGHVFNGDYLSFTALNVRGMDGTALTVAGTLGDYNGNFNNSDVGIEATDVGNCIRANANGNTNQGVLLTAGGQYYSGVSRANGGIGISVPSSGNVIMASCDGNNSSQINIPSGSNTENVVYGRYRKGSSAADPVWWTGRFSYFSGLCTGGTFNLRHADNFISGNIRDGLNASVGTAEGNVICARIDGTFNQGSGKTNKAYTQAGEHQRVTSYSANATLTLLEDRVTVDTTSGAVTITLPSASSNLAQGKEYRIKNVGTGGNNLTIESTTFADGEVAVFVSDGTNWIDFS